jgi:hypothetical protein
MNATKARSPAVGSLRLLLLVFRHLAAPFVSLVVSYATVIVGGLFISILRMGQFGFTIVCGVVGFTGVIVGARSLPVATRRFSSIGLLLLGLAYYYYIASWSPETTEEGKTVNMHDVSLRRFIFLGLGGLLAVIVIWRWPNKKSPQNIAAVLAVES